VRADLSISGDSLGNNAPAVRNLAWGSFWVQLPLTVVSASILFFASFVTAQSVRALGLLAAASRGRQPRAAHSVEHSKSGSSVRR
jgi:hypothetical protein